MTTVLVAASADVVAGPGEPDRLLGAAERSRAARFRSTSDRLDFVAARVLARTLVAEHAGVSPDDVVLAQTCASCGGPHGRPQVVGLEVHVGWSRSAGLVAAVVADQPVAIDLEAVGRLRERDLPLAVLATAEHAWLADQPDPAAAFARLWVRKEVLVKLGAVTLGEVGAVDVTPSFAGGTVLGRTLLELDAAPYDAVAAWGQGG